MPKPASGFSLKCSASGSQNSLSPIPLKELHPNLGFERLNLQAQSGLTAMNEFRRATEIQRLRQRKK